MKLYSAKLSPFASRVRLAIYAKQLPIEIVYPPEAGLKSPEYLAINPLGKLPCLVTDSGMALPESEVIMEYLEDAFPERPLRPASPEDRAKARLITRIVDLYLGPPGSALFRQMNPTARDPAVVTAQLDLMMQALDWLETLLSDTGYAVGDRLSTADCSIAPLLHFLPTFAGVFDRAELLEAHPKVTRYREAIRRDPAAAKVLAEIDEAAAHLQKTGGLI